MESTPEVEAVQRKYLSLAQKMLRMWSRWRPFAQRSRQSLISWASTDPTGFGF